MSPNLPGETDRCMQLTMAGWQVVEAADEIQAFAMVKAQHVDLAVLHLPVNDTVDMDLPDVLRRVCSSAYLPVMILADSARDQLRCRFLDSGADDVLSADTPSAEMVARAGALLRVKALHDQLSASRTALQEALQRERRLMAKLRRDNAELRDLATTDPLTHVQNVRSFSDILEHEYNVAKRYNQHLSLLMLDVDHFKVVNDTHGHPSGDYVLKELAVILIQSVRDSDVVARTGGEEFSVLLSKADRDHATQFAERIREEVAARQFVVYGQHIHITTSIGSATYPDDAQITEPDMLVYSADQALLTAKETGRDRVVAFCELGPAVRERLRRQYEAAHTIQGEHPCEAAAQSIARDVHSLV